MKLNEIEHKIAAGELTAAQVFTQMKQHIKPEKRVIRRGDVFDTGGN